MQPGFIARASNAPLPEDAVIRATNHATAKKAKKEKDNKKTRKARSKQAKLDQGSGTKGQRMKETRRTTKRRKTTRRRKRRGTTVSNGMHCRMMPRICPHCSWQMRTWIHPCEHWDPSCIM
jgi:hypothetical protein